MTIMDKPNKCKNCQWYGKPYWSIINPCDNCPNENNYKTIIQIDGEPVFKEAMEGKLIFEEKNKEIERLKNNWNELKKWIEKERDKWEAYNPMCYVYYQSILDRMEEVKGSDKSE